MVVFSLAKPSEIEPEAALCQVQFPLPSSLSIIMYFSTIFPLSTQKSIKQKTEAEEAPPGEPKVEETPAAAVVEKEAVPAEPAEPAEQAAVSDLSPMPPPEPHSSHLPSWWMCLLHFSHPFHHHYPSMPGFPSTRLCHSMPLQHASSYQP